jgi:hypothetical protein
MKESTNLIHKNIFTTFREEKKVKYEDNYIESEVILFVDNREKRN